MNSLKNMKIKWFLLLMTVVNYQLNAQPEDCDELDLMVDFAYPVSIMQSVRQNLSQAVYFLQQNNQASIYFLLQDAISKLSLRQNVQQDDRDFIQEMIDQINALIEELEESQRSTILDLCQQLQDKL